MSGNNGCQNDENDYEKALRERDEAYRYIVDHSTTRDHACASCYPQSDCLVPDFVCLYHRARLGLRLDET